MEKQCINWRNEINSIMSKLTLIVNPGKPAPGSQNQGTGAGSGCQTREPEPRQLLEKNGAAPLPRRSRGSFSFFWLFFSKRRGAAAPSSFLPKIESRAALLGAGFTDLLIVKDNPLYPSKINISQTNGLRRRLKKL